MELLKWIRKQKTEGRREWFVVTMEGSYQWRCTWMCCSASAVHSFIHNSDKRIDYRV